MNRSYWILGICLFVLMNLPQQWTDRWRSHTACVLGPLWQAVAVQTPEIFTSYQNEDDLTALRMQVGVLQEWLLDEKRLYAQAESLATLLGQAYAPSREREDLKRRAARQQKILAMRTAGILTQVIFRDPTSWGSTLWIALGESDNQSFGKCVVGRNSPVLVGNSLVGVVEYVGHSQSRVRIITDAGLVLAVRALRGGEQNRELSNCIEHLLDRIKTRSDLFASREEQEQFMKIIQSFEERLVPSWEEELLAKGELSGCSAPLWRSRGCMLKGIGFNYHYADEEGSARDLRTGRVFGVHSSPTQPLLKVGDLLVTSGLDGLFPAGIHVAIATKIHPLKEGSYAYELEAKPTAGDLQDLHTVLVLPPIGFVDKSEA